MQKRKRIEPIQCKCPVGTCRSAAECRTLLTICPQGQIGRRFPYPAPKQNSIPSGCCFVLGKKEGNRTHPMQVPGGHLPFGSWMPNAPYDLPLRANRPSIPVPSKAPSMAQLTTFILNRFIFFPPVLPVLGDQKSREQLCGFCQLRNCAAARILIVSKLNAK